MNKVMSYQIIKPLDMEWKLFDKILLTLQKETMIACNKTIQICKEWLDFSEEYKNKNGEYPKLIDFKGYKMLSAVCYDKIKSFTTTLNSGNLSTSISSADKKFNAFKKDILRGEMSIPSFRSNLPIDLHNKSISIYKERNKYIANFSLLSNIGKSSFNLEKGQIKCLLNVKDNSQKSIIERCLDCKNVSASQILKKKNKWILNLNYKVDVKKNNLSEDKIMGIDLGVQVPAYCAYNFDEHLRFKINDSRIINTKIINKKSLIQQKNDIDNKLSISKSQRQFACDGSVGHGRKARMKLYNKYSNKSKNLSDTINHTWSKLIVREAIKNNCGVIQMEDLSNIKNNTKDSKFLKNWTYYDLQTKITYKAEENGIKVIKVNPKYTSQRCSKCGYIDKYNRPTQSKFKCLKCGYEANADFNAAKNISTKNIDNIIKLQKIK